MAVDRRVQHPAQQQKHEQRIRHDDAILRKRQRACKRSQRQHVWQARKRKGRKASRHDAPVKCKVVVGIVANKVVRDGSVQHHKAVQPHAQHQVSRRHQRKQRPRQKHRKPQFALAGIPHKRTQHGRQQVQPYERVQVPQVVPGLPLKKVQEGRPHHGRRQRVRTREVRVLRDGLHQTERKPNRQQDESHAPDIASHLAKGHFSPRVQDQRAGHHEEHRHRPAGKRNLRDALNPEQRWMRGGKPRRQLRRTHRVQRNDGEGPQGPRPLKPVDCPSVRQAKPSRPREKSNYSPLWAFRNFSTSANVGIAACAPTFVTQRAAAAEAYTMLSWMSPPKQRWAASSPT